MTKNYSKTIIKHIYFMSNFLFLFYNRILIKYNNFFSLLFWILYDLYHEQVVIKLSKDSYSLREKNMNTQINYQ
jgi:hypothetical protein